MADTNEPVLELSTLVERPKISIDGKRYEIASPGELSVLDHQRLASLGGRLDALMALRQLTTAQEGELGQVIAAISKRIMIGVPGKVARKLSDEQRLSVIEVFTELLPDRPAAMAEAQRTGRSKGRTGARTPHGSAGSTAAARSNGSPKRRSPSSERVSP